MVRQPESQKSQKDRQLSLPVDSPLLAAVRNDRNVMVYPWFPLYKEPRTTKLEFDDGRVEITVRPGPAGMATAWDKEFLIYVISLMAQRMERGELIDQRFTFAAADFFRVAGISDSGRSYQRVEGALDRLQSTSIRTNIQTGGEITKGFFSWLDSAKVTYRLTSRIGPDGEPVRMMDKVTVTLCEWLWRAVKHDNRLFQYDPRFFDLAPLEQRLYEIARAHCSKAGFRMWLDKLQARVGSEDTLRKFKMKLKAISAKKRPLPGYQSVDLAIVD
jgi:plasmid replication initiation protein